MLPGVFGSIPCLQSFCKQERNTLVYQSIFGPVFMRNSNAGDCSLTSGHTGTSVGGSSKVNGTLVRFSATILSQNKGEIVLPLIIPTTSRPTSIEAQLVVLTIFLLEKKDPSLFTGMGEFLVE